MRYHSNYKLSKIKIIVLLVVLALVISLILLSLSISGHYNEICKKEAKEASGNAISYSISTLTSNNKLDSSDFVSIKYNDKNEITSIESNTNQINKVQSEILSYINDYFNSKKTGDNEYSVPLGTLTGGAFLNGKGPNVKFKFSQVGSPEVSLKSTFSSSGINQTLHQIYAYIEIEVYSIAPKKSKPVLFKFDYLITETVIVGEIPDTYISIPKK